jgi:hypothetical protein
MHNDGAHLARKPARRFGFLPRVRAASFLLVPARGAGLGTLCPRPRRVATWHARRNAHGRVRCLPRRERASLREVDADDYARLLAELRRLDEALHPSPATPRDARPRCSAEGCRFAVWWSRRDGPLGSLCWQHARAAGQPEWSHATLENMSPRARRGFERLCKRADRRMRNYAVALVSGRATRTLRAMV